VSLWYDEHDE
jgi:alpha-1,3-glucosyltransferase